MPLTDKHMRNLDMLPLTDILEIVDYCLSERAGAMTVKQFIAYTKTPKSTVYKMIKDGNLKTTNILGNIVIITNI